MWVYRSVADQSTGKSRRVWEVGYLILGAWMGTAQYTDERGAMRAVHYLNGGDGMPVPWAPAKMKK